VDGVTRLVVCWFFLFFFFFFVFFFIAGGQTHAPRPIGVDSASAFRRARGHGFVTRQFAEVRGALGEAQGTTIRRLGFYFSRCDLRGVLGRALMILRSMRTSRQASPMCCKRARSQSIEMKQRAVGLHTIEARDHGGEGRQKFCCREGDGHERPRSAGFGTRGHERGGRDDSREDSVCSNTETTMNAHSGTGCRCG